MYIHVGTCKHMLAFLFIYLFIYFVAVFWLEIKRKFFLKTEDQGGEYY